MRRALVRAKAPAMIRGFCDDAAIVDSSSWLSPGGRFTAEIAEKCRGGREEKLDAGDFAPGFWCEHYACAAAALGCEVISHSSLEKGK